ncbi:hypothetical protein BDM02DRAFT_3182254 [Thelephora ganbajun]|uniref:Uncharacterized protein n=1 Tax=Thelephora ganbajun TaxID=370292 RepID=A0ACB6ZWJ3_THEGA|nr:hypothetical protein BDM02DRAFT_3182254 [Thelephora ganbajun]
MATPPIQHAARSQNPSEIASLHGEKAKTPIIAGSVSGACVLLAWTIGFIVFFVRRRRQIRRAKEAGFKSHRDIIDFVPIPNAMTFIIPPDPALVGSRKSHDNHIRDLEQQGQLQKSPVSETHLRGTDQPERETTPSPEGPSRTNSTTNSTPRITTMGPSTVDLSTVESNYPMLDSSSRLPLTPISRKTPADREK